MLIGFPQKEHLASFFSPNISDINIPLYLFIWIATALTEAGYVGEDVENILLRLLQAADFDIEKAQKGIIYVLYRQFC